MTNLIPVPMDRARLASLLHDIATSVLNGDSFEGSLEYMMPDPDAPPGWPSADCEFWVSGVYRVGNSMGQGGMRMIGTPPS